MSASSATAIGARRRIGARLATSAAPSAITSTEAIASEAEDHVEPHNSANCTIDLVSSSMKPAPRKKKCHDHGGGAAVTAVTAPRPVPDPVPTRSGLGLDPIET